MVDNLDIKLEELKKHQRVVDDAIRVLKKDYISVLTEVSRSFKRILRKSDCNDTTIVHNSTMVSIKLAYLYYVLDSLKSYKYFKDYYNHPLVIKSVNNAINLIENKEVISFIKRVNKVVTNILFPIPDNIKEDALKQVACGGCKTTSLIEIGNKSLVLRPTLSTLCCKCGATSLIEFNVKEKDS